MSRRPPDVCQFVFVCGFSDWQIQGAPRARSDVGGAVALWEAFALAHRDHMFEAHTAAEREGMRRQLASMNAPDNITQPRGEEHLSGLLVGVPLPRWWVEK